MRERSVQTKIVTSRRERELGSSQDQQQSLDRVKDIVIPKKDLKTADSQPLEESIRSARLVLRDCPNEFSRLFLLTSMRDYNSGIYRHPSLSRVYGSAEASRAFEFCHRELFDRLVAFSIEEYVHQLKGYIRYTRAERRAFIKVWKSLQAYRAAIPLDAQVEVTQVFFLNVGLALSILEAEDEMTSSATEQYSSDPS